MAKIEYEHTYIQQTASDEQHQAAIPLSLTDALNAWGSGGWEVVHMEAVWSWHTHAEAKTWPEQLLGYYVTFKRESDAGSGSQIMAAVAELPEEIFSGLDTPEIVLPSEQN